LVMVEYIKVYSCIKSSTHFFGQERKLFPPYNLNVPSRIIPTYTLVDMVLIYSLAVMPSNSGPKNLALFFGDLF